jgi:uroporphyrinogen-III synthase
MHQDKKVVVLTRPEGHNERLAALVSQMGASAMVLPWLRSVPNIDVVELMTWWKREAPRHESIVFVSHAAVEYAIPEGLVWPDEVWAVATGRGTASALEQKGVPLDRIRYPVQQLDSEGIWKECRDCFCDKGRVTIFRGQDGRSWLGDQVVEHGGEINYYSVYVREVCREAISVLNRWAEEWGNENAIQERYLVVTNSEAAMAIIPHVIPSLWEKVTVFVPHVRIERTLRALGIPYVVLTPGGDDGISATLSVYLK